MRPAILLYMLMLVVLSGCLADREPTTAATRSAPTETYSGPDLDYESEWKPLSGDSPGGSSAEPLVENADLPRIRAAAKADRSRKGAETFAVLVAMTYIESREKSPKPEVFIDAVTAPEFPAPKRDHLIDDMKLQRQGTMRHFSSDSGGWLRSIVSGSQDAPHRVNVEVAGFLTSVPLDVESWYRTRYDVVWGKDGWRLIDFADGKFGPDDHPKMTKGETEDEWGPGWREIPPA